LRRLGRKLPHWKPQFLQLLDGAYPPQTAIKLIFDNHSAHISKETRAWLASWPLSNTSTSTPSSTPGHTNSTVPHDTIRSSETMN
jgi:hypothetical protein